jgi:thioredoxin-like negative regulator of GroEL
MIEVYYYSAPWCQPCKSFKPQTLAKIEAAGYLFHEIDVDQETELAANENIMTLPTVQFMYRGEEKIEEFARVAGASTKQLTEALDKAKGYVV